MTLLIFLTETLIGQKGYSTLIMSVTNGTMLNFDGDFDEYSDGDVRCKQTFTLNENGAPSNELQLWYCNGETLNLHEKL